MDDLGCKGLGWGVGMLVVLVYVSFFCKWFNRLKWVIRLWKLLVLVMIVIRLWFRIVCNWVRLVLGVRVFGVVFIVLFIVLWKCGVLVWILSRIFDLLIILISFLLFSIGNCEMLVRCMCWKVVSRVLFGLMLIIWFFLKCCVMMLCRLL